MKVNGYMLKEQIKQSVLKVNSLFARLERGLFVFDEMEKQKMIKLALDLTAENAKLVELQTTQQIYNTLNFVEILGEKMTLAEAIKTLGPSGRMVTLWKTMALDDGINRYDRGSRAERTADAVYAERAFSPDDCISFASSLEEANGKYRQAIARANVVEIEI